MEAGAATAAASGEATESRKPRNRRRGGRILDVGLNVYAGLALLYLLVPIAIILVYSFNNPRGRFNFVWQEFSLEAWTEPFAVPGIGDALLTSLEIAALSTLGRDRAGHPHRSGARALRVQGPRRLSTSSSSSRWLRPRSCWAPRCCRCSSTSP